MTGYNKTAARKVKDWNGKEGPDQKTAGKWGNEKKI